VTIKRKLTCPASRAKPIRECKGGGHDRKSNFLGGPALRGGHEFSCSRAETPKLDQWCEFCSDANEHMGQLIGYARMTGVAPPWAKS